jgi:hypothetical protein
MRFIGSAKARRSAAEHHGKSDHARARNTPPAQRNIRRPPNNIAIKPAQKANSRNTVCFPVFPSYFAAKCQVAGRLDCTPNGWELTPTDPGCLACKFDSDDFLQDPSDALLDRLGSLCGDFLSEAPKFHILRGCDVEVLARLPG